MFGGDDRDKTEEPTGKRLGEAQDRGEFARSAEITIVFTLIGAFIVLLFKGNQYATQVCYYARDILSDLRKTNLSEEGVVLLFREGILFLSRILFPLLATCTLAVVLAGGLQSGFHLAKENLEPKLERLNPWNGIQRLFSTDNTVQLGIDFCKLVLVGFIIYGAVDSIRYDPIFYTPVPVPYIGEFILRVFLILLVRLIFALGVLAALHYLYQRYSVHKTLMMTRQEVQDEQRQATGSPEVKGAQRRFALRLLRRQMLNKIPTADVVITNPTHFAIALKYERGEDLAPIVLAKGADLFAQKIKEIAHAHGVPMVENRPAAQLLYKLGVVGRTIPTELYEVVANILSFVYRTHRYYFYRLKARRLQEKKEDNTTNRFSK